jgi:hypothetical protein
MHLIFNNHKISLLSKGKVGEDGRGRVDGIPLVWLRCMGLSGYERLRERLRARGVVLSERGGE